MEYVLGFLLLLGGVVAITLFAVWVVIRITE
jgi:hypothetical protein